MRIRPADRSPTMAIRETVTAREAAAIRAAVMVREADAMDAAV